MTLDPANLVKCVIGAVALLGSTAALATTYTVVGVSDGDTVKVLSESKQQIKCRLHGIDAPEKAQDFGQASKQSLSGLIYKKTVDVNIVNQDRYGRSVCKISVNGLDVNREQISRGMAWHYRQYSNDASYSQAEASAKVKKIGLWSRPDPTPPWKFRKEQRN